MVNLAAILWSLGAIGLWSTNALGANIALSTLTTAQTQFLQFSSASLVFYLFSRRKNPADSSKKFSLFALAIGTIGLTGTMVFQYLAFRIGPIVQVNLIAYSWPLLAVLFAVAFRDIRNPLSQILVALLGFLGVALVVLESTSYPAGNGAVLGVIFALMSALCMAGYSYYIGKIDIKPERTLLPASLIGCAITAIWCLIEFQSWPVSYKILIGLYLGAGPMGLGYFFWSKAMRLDTAGQLYVLGFLTPILSTTLLAISGSQLTLQTALGGLLVVAACFIVTHNGRIRTTNARPDPARVTRSQ